MIIISNYLYFQSLFVSVVNGRFLFRKAKVKLEKYAEPLLHLSGFLVNTVKTERIDEARDLASIIEKTNIIAIAGGDGTLFEVNISISLLLVMSPLKSF